MKELSRRTFTALSAAAVTAFAAGIAKTRASEAEILQVYKSPWCGCCGAWIDHMRSAGFGVRVTELDDLAPLKARHGVPEDLQSCHTALIEGYVVEGHVPAREVARLLAERPEATGLSVPGMPVGSPGMEQGARRDPYEVVLFSASSRGVFARY